MQLAFVQKPNDVMNLLGLDNCLAEAFKIKLDPWNAKDLVSLQTQL